MFGPSIGESFSVIINDALIAENKKNKRRDYLGASRWGEECDRKLGYEYFASPMEEAAFDGETLRIFQMGHDGEKQMAQYLRTAKFEVHTEMSDGSQYGFTLANGKLRGHIDGVISNGPLEIKYPVIWENKALGQKSFNDVVRNGLKKSKPVYYAQANVYMYYISQKYNANIYRCLFTILNRDNGRVHAEYIEFDSRNAQDASDRAVRVIRAQNPEELSRCANDETDYRCKMCNFAKKCWSNKNVPKVTAHQAPNWLKNAKSSPTGTTAA